MKEVGLKIRQVREELQLSQEDLARRTDLLQKQISRYETGHTDPSPEKLRKIAEVLDISLDWLVGRTENRHGIEVAKPPFSPEALEAAELISSLDSEADQRFALNILSFTVTEIRLRSRSNSGQ